MRLIVALLMLLGFLMAAGAMVLWVGLQALAATQAVMVGIGGLLVAAVSAGAATIIAQLEASHQTMQALLEETRKGNKDEIARHSRKEEVDPTIQARAVRPFGQSSTDDVDLKTCPSCSLQTERWRGRCPECGFDYVTKTPMPSQPGGAKA